MSHPYAELFSRKLNDMGLVLFEKHRDWDNWEVARDSDKHFMVSANFQYFLCLPKHNDTGQCLHWLDGGKVQDYYKHASTPKWLDIESDEVNWTLGHLFMDDRCEIRIKPIKEKRWLVYNSKGVLQGEYKNLPENLDGAQCVEVEITVTK